MKVAAKLVKASENPITDKADDQLVKALKKWANEYRKINFEITYALPSVLMKAFGESAFMAIYKDMKQVLGKKR
jgi:hypothetical protein